MKKAWLLILGIALMPAVCAAESAKGNYVWAEDGQVIDSAAQANPQVLGEDFKNVTLTSQAGNTIINNG